MVVQSLLNNKNALLALVVLFLPWFFFHDSIPGGFYIDETSAASHAICFKHFGINFGGDRWPLYSGAKNAGHTAPTYFYPLVIWTAVFGDSITSLRFLSTVVTLCTIAMLFLLGRRMGFARNSIAIPVIAALSPWAFQYSRIAWDPPFAPLLFMGSIYLALEYRSKAILVLASITTVLSMYAYGPFKFSVPLFWLGWVLYNRWPLKDIVLFGLVSTVCVMPLLHFSFFGEGQHRIAELSVFGNYGLNPVANQPMTVKLLAAVKNTFMHLDPKFLFWSGDTNIRHSPPFTGQASVFSLLVFILFIAGLLYRQIRFENGRFWFLCLWGVFCVFASSGSTYDGVPHSLRSIGAWPFLVLMFAFMLEKIRSHINVGFLVLAVALQFTYFHYNYSHYGQHFSYWFDTGAIADIEKNRGNLDDVNYHVIAKFYHQVRLGWLNEAQMLAQCESAGLDVGTQ